MAEIREYLTVAGISPYGRWLAKLAKLDRQATARVVMAITRLSEGNTGKLKSLGPGLAEIRIDFGPGYRVYVGWDGPALILLLGGGTKKTQDEDIAMARERWRDYRIRKRGDLCH
jgi:putative addiction module killer protein